MLCIIFQLALFILTFNIVIDNNEWEALGQHSPPFKRPDEYKSHPLPSSPKPACASCIIDYNTVAPLCLNMTTKLRVLERASFLAFTAHVYQIITSWLILITLKNI